MVKILCINPNSSSEVTEGIEKICQEYAWPGTEVEIKSIKEAPLGIESYHDAAISEKYLLDINDPTCGYGIPVEWMLWENKAINTSTKLEKTRNIA